MPFKSEAQRRYMYANEPEIASRWSREKKVVGQLPERVNPRKKRKRGTGSKLLDTWNARRT